MHNSGIIMDEPQCWTIRLSISLAIGVLALVGNCLLVKSSRSNVASERSFHSFVISLGVSGLLGGLVAVLDGLRYTFLYESDHMDLACRSQTWLLQTQQLAFLGSLFALVLDRYLAISRPIQYHVLMTSTVAGLLLALVWVGSGLLAALALNHEVDASSLIYCRLTDITSPNQFHIYALSSFCFMLATVVYYIKLVKQRTRIAPFEVNFKNKFTEMHLHIHSCSLAQIWVTRLFLNICRVMYSAQASFLL